MNSCEMLVHINILEAIRGTPVSITAVATACSSSRPTIRRFLNDAEDWGLVRHSDDGYVLTAAGDCILREYHELDGKHQTGIALIVDSEHRLELLRAIGSHPTDKAALARKTDASRPTVYRNMKKFQKRKWICEQDNHLELTSEGEKIIEIYEAFREKVCIIEDKIEFLKRLEDIENLPPIEALAGSRMVVSTFADRREVVREINDLDVTDMEPLRGISHTFSKEISEEYASKVPLDTKCELIVDRSVYSVITNPKRWKYLFNGFDRPNFRLLILPEDISVGIGLFGDERATISAYNAEYPIQAALIGENEALIQWVEQIYERYYAQANPPRTDLLKWAVGR